MKRVLIISLIVLMLFPLFGQYPRDITLNRDLGIVGKYWKINFFLTEVTIFKNNYDLLLSFEKCLVINQYEIDYVYIENKESNEIEELYNNLDNQKITISIPRKYDKVYLKGVGADDKDFTIDLLEFERYILDNKYDKAFLGAFLSNHSGRKGASIDNVLPGSPADIAGLKMGYSIIQVNKETCTDVYSLTRILNNYYDNDKVIILYINNIGNINKTNLIFTSKSKYNYSLISSDDISLAKQDKVLPEIKIKLNGNHRTVDAQMLLKGSVIDNEGIFQVYVNNELASLKSNGEFQKRIKLKIGKNPIEIKAVDINDNEKIEEILVIRDEIIEEKEFSDIDFAFETSNNKPNAIAVVFGIEEYQYAPNVTNAYNDAEIIREYFISTFGLKRENIYFRYNERATKGEFEKVFSENGWISKNADPNSEIYVFYAGHGIASIDDKSAYLIPNDIDPNYANTGFSLKELYQNLSKIKSKSTTVILDACFSGISRENEMLLADSRPISIEVKQGSIPENLNVFNASSGSEISSGYSQKLHGLFTYFFLKGLNKNADLNNNNEITYGEMENYLKENVSLEARKMGREQNPQLHTNDKDKILLKY